MPSPLRLKKIHLSVRSSEQTPACQEETEIDKEERQEVGKMGI